MKKLFILVIVMFLLGGCSSKDSDNGLISYMDAKEKIINEGAVLVDVRTEDEYNNKHIGGAINVPIDSISSAVSLSKDNPIIVYCETGNRSSQALEKLEALGYSNVYDLGSINNWEE